MKKLVLQGKGRDGIKIYGITYIVPILDLMIAKKSEMNDSVKKK